ncbi:MAG: L-threonylcarbamoyladenylate synthase [Flavobacteriales bacterium]
MILNIHPENPNQRKMEMVNECLKEGGTIIYPTDTVYSFGCDLANTKAMEKVAKLKDKKLEMANFSIIFSDLSLLSYYTRPIENPTFKLLKKATPGPFTFILEANNNVPKLFKSKKKTVGIRLPNNKIARQIVKELGNPIISSSVYHEDEILEYSTDPEDIHEKYKNDVDIVVNGGVSNTEPSTVVDLTNERPHVVRQGIGEIEQYV